MEGKCNVYYDCKCIDISIQTKLQFNIPIHFMFGSTVGFSGSADRMGLIPVLPNSIGMWEKPMREEYNWIGHNLKYFLYFKHDTFLSVTVKKWLKSVCM